MKLLTSEPNAFRSKANQFVVSLRSMPYLLKTDYNSRPGFNDWFRAQIAELWLDPEWQRLKQMRDLALKERVVSFTDFGTAEDALSFFERQQRTVELLVRACLVAFEGPGATI